MIKHIVMWDVQGESAAEKRVTAELVKSQFETLVGKIPGMSRMEIGIDFSGVDYACDVVLYSEFDTIDALTAYAIHPEHLRVKSELGNCRIARHQVDYK